jgi:phage gp46-like protein
MGTSAPFLTLRFDPVELDGDLADVADDSGVETEALIALATDARVDAADLVDALLSDLGIVAPPSGRPNRGYWADVVLDDGEQTGSRLWLLEGATASEVSIARVEALVAETLEPIVRAGRITGFDAGVSVDGQNIIVAPTLRLPDGSTRTLGALRVN